LTFIIKSKFGFSHHSPRKKVNGHLILTPLST